MASWGSQTRRSHKLGSRRFAAICAIVIPSVYALGIGMMKDPKRPAQAKPLENCKVYYQNVNKCERSERNTRVNSTNLTDQVLILRAFFDIFGDFRNFENSLNGARHPTPLLRCLRSLSCHLPRFWGAPAQKMAGDQADHPEASQLQARARTPKYTETTHGGCLSSGRKNDLGPGPGPLFPLNTPGYRSQCRNLLLQHICRFLRSRTHQP